MMGETEAVEIDDILDDWFIESLKSYKDLHVYQLEHPTQIIEWTSGKTVCVAGYSSGKNEILELCLPLKLLADEKKSLCAERDFKVVHGGFSEGPVCCLTHIPGTRCAVTNDGLTSDLQLWDLGADDTDVIRKTGSLPGTSVSQAGSRIAARLSSPPQVLHGPQSSSVQLTQLSTGQTLYRLEVDSTEPLSSLKFVSETTFLASCCDGTVYLADTRTSAPPQASPPPGECAPWWTDASAAPQCRVIRLSSSGQAVVSDLRNLGGALCRAQLDVQTLPRKPEDVTVAWAPALDGCFSVSGLSGLVQIYDSAGWRAEPQDASPLFQHAGHSVSSQHGDGSAPVFITTHVWHPERPRTLLSAASDGSVHVWDWVDPQTN
ncbi:PREDICTED: WD repeat-containing protein 73 [Poecilia mexicana]|uniref:WD repeat domain 73 n=1 Tax=Poecilia mexicana TaxID=48701 RepID=A0A3B3XKK4_9TELE|nr:PREDICTED: WD repeat-containing protein 73 [Poecilia mexicana]